MTGIVHHDIEASLLSHDLRDRGVGRWLRADVEFERVQIDVVLRSEFLDVGDLRRVAALGAAHRRIDRMTRFGQGVCRKPPKAAGSPGDDDNLFHDEYPCCDRLNGNAGFRPCRHWRAAPVR
jgi:hypothetical protein